MKHLHASIGLVALVTSSNNFSGGSFSALAFTPIGTQSKCIKTRRSTSRLQVSSLNSDSKDAQEDKYDTAELMASEMEQARLSNQYARYSHDDWLRHRASDRFFANLFKFDKSPIVKNLLDEAAILAVICVGIILWNELLIEGWTDLNEVHHEAPLADLLPSALTFKLALPTEPFFLCGGPLGLLLVFRNDCSFGRYKDAFHHWEVACSSLGNMILMAASSGTSNVEGVKQLSAASWAVVRTLQHEVSGGFDTTYAEDLKKNMPDEQQVQRLLSARNKLHRSHYDVHRAVDAFSEDISNLDKRTIINTFNNVATACAECERLYMTPIPLLYTRHTLKFLTLWMAFMPFAFYDVFATSWNHTGMIPAICIICFLFFGIEEIAVSLEEPFSILPLNELVEEFQENAQETIEWMEEEHQASTKEAPMGIEIKV
ncbi:bestrophin family protein [Skeletonema marinoi]|uniref:Bestrophin family protein n=1 Tax=Skeletonema marinoi TaxID=267567 RepID=A0AAD9DG83_9STRA|nr:bestrophin family protein [Skeletonema marinoi]